MKKLWNTDIKRFYIKLWVFTTILCSIFFINLYLNDQNFFNILTIIIYTIATLCLTTLYIKEFNLNFIKNLQFIFKPKLWDMNYPYDEHWDKLLNLLIDNTPATLDQINPISKECYGILFKINENYSINVWISNYPYAYGRPSYNNEPKLNPQIRPSRLTILKLRKLEKQLRLKNNTQ